MKRWNACRSPTEGDEGEPRALRRRSSPSQTTKVHPPPWDLAGGLRRIGADRALGVFFFGFASSSRCTVGGCWRCASGWDLELSLLIMQVMIKRTSCCSGWQQLEAIYKYKDIVTVVFSNPTHSLSRLPV